MRIFFWLKMSLWTESSKSTWASIITLYMTLNKYLSVRQEVSENDWGMSLHETQKFIWAAIKSNYCYIIYSKKRFLNLFQALYESIPLIGYRYQYIVIYSIDMRVYVYIWLLWGIDKNSSWICKLMSFYAKFIAWLNKKSDNVILRALIAWSP